MRQIQKPADKLDDYDEFTLRWMGSNPDQVVACEALKAFVEGKARGTQAAEERVRNAELAAKAAQEKLALHEQEVGRIIHKATSERDEALRKLAEATRQPPAAETAADSEPPDHDPPPAASGNPDGSLTN